LLDGGFRPIPEVLGIRSGNAPSGWFPECLQDLESPGFLRGLGMAQVLLRDLATHALSEAFRHPSGR